MEEKTKVNRLVYNYYRPYGTKCIKLSLVGILFVMALFLIAAIRLDILFGALLITASIFFFFTWLDIVIDNQKVNRFVYKHLEVRK